MDASIAIWIICGVVVGWPIGYLLGLGLLLFFEDAVYAFFDWCSSLFD